MPLNPSASPTLLNFQKCRCSVRVDGRCGWFQKGPLRWCFPDSYIGLWHRILRPAESLAEYHTPFVGSRSLDIIHVAAASVLGIAEFCTFDSRQSDLARRVGLSPSALSLAERCSGV